MIYQEIHDLLAKEELIESLKYLEDNKNQLGRYYLLYKCRTMDLMGDHKNALSILDKLSISLKSDFDLILNFAALISKCYIFWHISKYEELLHLLDECENQIKKFDENVSDYQNYWISMYCHLKANHYYGNGIYNEALKWYDRAIIIRKDIKDYFGLGDSNVNMGDCHFDLGNIKESKYYFQQAIKSYELAENPIEIGYAKCEISAMYRKLGNVTQSLEIAKENLDFFKKHASDHPYYGQALHEYGASLSLINPKEGKKYLIEAIKIKEKFSNDYELAYTLLEYAQLITRNSPSADEIESINDKILKIEERGPNEYTLVLIELTKAILIKANIRIFNKFRSLVIFEKLLNNPLINENFSIKYIILTNLIELYLLEYQLMDNEDIKVNIEDCLSELTTVANITSSNFINLQNYILQSKYQIIQGNFEKAFQLINQAQKIVSDKFPINFQNQIDNALELLEKINDNSTSFLSRSISQRIQETKVLEYLREVNNFINKKRLRT